jgi:hypothetical protein
VDSPQPSLRAIRSLLRLHTCAGSDGQCAPDNTPACQHHAAESWLTGADSDHQKLCACLGTKYGLPSAFAATVRGNVGNLLDIRRRPLSSMLYRFWARFTLCKATPTVALYASREPHFRPNAYTVHLDTPALSPYFSGSSTV